MADRGADHSQEFHDIAGCRTEIFRGGAGAPLLFLHGANGIAGWMPFMTRLAGHFDLWAPSHPGFGQSDTPEWLDNIADLAYFYLDFLDRFGLDGVHLVGTSLGGWISAEIAVRDTGRIKSLTLVDAAGIHVKGVPKGDLFMWSAEEKIRNGFHDQKIAEKMLAATPSEADIDFELKNRFTAAKLAWHPRFYNPDLAKWLHRIDVPTLILWGDSDKIFPPAYGAAYHDLIPGSELRIVPRCGHAPQYEQVDDFIDGVLSVAGIDSP